MSLKYYHLLCRDFLTQKYRFLLLFAVLAFLMLCFGLSGVHIVAFLGIICFAPKVVELAASGDVMEGCEDFLLTTRFSRKDVVKARYLLFAASLVIIFLIGVLLCLITEGLQPLLIPALACSILYGSVSIPVCCLLDSDMTNPSKIGLTVLSFFQFGILIGSVVLFTTQTESILMPGFGILAASLVICAASYLISQQIYAKKEF